MTEVYYLIRLSYASYTSCLSSITVVGLGVLGSGPMLRQITWPHHRRRVCRLPA